MINFAYMYELFKCFKLKTRMHLDSLEIGIFSLNYCLSTQLPATYHRKHELGVEMKLLSCNVVIASQTCGLPQY